ncbi:rhamnogalacturonan acetylesterase [Streptomyces sp. NPDC006879]|uniref:rhamnogalacturonan acetylesterase n=1 Tax=Streptomyces sp. NPDC006879 TaxID=3364767 RepID=UPI00367876B5
MLHSGVPGAHHPRIFLAGGSAVVDREKSKAPMIGWGQVMSFFISPDIEILNCARAGASSRTFAERGRLAWILQNIRAGDYLLISFGGNDAKPEHWLRTEPFDDFPRYLRQFIDGARERNAHPVLVSQMERDTHDAHGNLSKSLPEYVMSTRHVATQTSTPYVDLYEQTHSWWAGMGAERTRSLFVHVPPGHPNYPDGFDDPGHLVPPGAIACARYIAYSLAQQRIIPPQWVMNLEQRDFPPEWVVWLDDDEHKRLTKERTLGS